MKHYLTISSVRDNAAVWAAVLFTAIVLLAITGCASAGNGRAAGSGVGVGVDHGEHPADLQHGDTMQK